MGEQGKNGAKAFGGIMAVLAVLGGMAAIMQPMNNRLSAVEDQLVRHVEKLDHPVRVEASVENLTREVRGHTESQGHPPLAERVKALESNGVAMRHHDRLIRMLWQKTYGESMPAVNGDH